MARGKKTGGRRKGTPNKVTVQVKDKIATLFDDYDQEQMQADFMQLKPLDRLKMLVSLAEYVIPKQSRATIEQENEAPQQVILYLPDNGR
jgi:hypothetical protein